MPPPVYTELFGDFFLSFGDVQTLGPVPAGFRWIVHDVSGRMVNDTQPTLLGLVWGTDAHDLYDWQCPAYGRRPFHWRGRQVINAGGRIVVTCPGTTSGSGPFCVGAVTGQQLSLP
jgi:hypothetical protein